MDSLSPFTVCSATTKPSTLNEGCSQLCVLQKYPLELSLNLQVAGKKKKKNTAKSLPFSFSPASADYSSIGWSQLVFSQRFHPDLCCACTSFTWSWRNLECEKSSARAAFGSCSSEPPFPSSAAHCTSGQPDFVVRENQGVQREKPLKIYLQLMAWSSCCPCHG